MLIYVKTWNEQQSFPSILLTDCHNTAFEFCVKEIILSPVSHLDTVFFVFGCAPSIVFVCVIANFLFISVQLNLTLQGRYCALSR